VFAHEPGMYRRQCDDANNDCKNGLQPPLITAIAEPNSDLVDYSVLDVFLPHPDYSKQHFVCILNPSGEHVETTKQLIIEAHSIAAARLQRKTQHESDTYPKVQSAGG